MDKEDSLQNYFGDHTESINDTLEEELYEHDEIEADTGYDVDGCITSNEPSSIAAGESNTRSFQSYMNSVPEVIHVKDSVELRDFL